MRLPSIVAGGPRTSAGRRRRRRPRRGRAPSRRRGSSPRRARPRPPCCRRRGCCAASGSAERCPSGAGRPTARRARRAAPACARRSASRGAGGGPRRRRASSSRGRERGSRGRARRERRGARGSRRRRVRPPAARARGTRGRRASPARGRAAGARRRRRTSRRRGRPGSRVAAACRGRPGTAPRSGTGAGRRRPRRRRPPPPRRAAGSSRRSASTRLRRYGTTPGKPSSSPWRSTAFASADRSETGTSSEKPWRSATSKRASRSRRGPWRCHGRMAPSRRLFDSSGITRSASTAQRRPRPSQAGQAPCALLNENERGESSGTDTSHRAQASFWERSRSPLPSTETSTTPEARSSAFCRLARRRSRVPSRRARRSTSTSMRCVRRGSSRDGLEEARGAAVDARALEAAGPGGGELLAVAALPAARDGRRHHRDEAVGLLHEPPRHLVGALRGDRLGAARAVGLPEAREEDTQVVVDLAHRADRRARVGDGRALLDGDCRREAAHRLDGRALHLLEELPGPRREALDVAPLALGVERVEGEAALPGPRGAGDHHEPLARDVAVEVLEVVDPCAADADRLVSSLVHHAPAKTPSYRDGGRPRCPRLPVVGPHAKVPSLSSPPRKRRV